MRGFAWRVAVHLSRLLSFVQHRLSGFSCLGRQRRFGISRLRSPKQAIEEAACSCVRTLKHVSGSVLSRRLSAWHDELTAAIGDSGGRGTRKSAAVLPTRQCMCHLTPQNTEQSFNGSKASFEEPKDDATQPLKNGDDGMEDAGEYVDDARDEGADCRCDGHGCRCRCGMCVDV